MCGDHKSTVVHRLSSIAGHVKSVERMIREDAYCIDIIEQTQEIQAVLAKVRKLSLDQYVQRCVSREILSDEVSENECVHRRYLTFIM